MGTMAQGLSLVQRGFLLLGGMLLIAGGVLGWMFFSPGGNNPAGTSARTADTQPVTAVVFVPSPGFPATVAWGQLAYLEGKLPSTPGWAVRYNAAIALARRGSQHVPWEVVREMLDEAQQLRNRRVLVQDRWVIDEVRARQTVLNALKAVVHWHQRVAATPGSDQAVLVCASASSFPATIAWGPLACLDGTRARELQRVRAAIDRLRHSDNAVLRKEAADTLATLAKH
jgi:hypothetical protein